MRASIFERTIVLDIMLQILQWIILAVILAAFSLIPLTGLYLASQEFRDIVKDFQRWEASRRFKRRMPARIAAYTPPPQPKRHATIYDRLVDELQFDPRDDLRRKKEQDAKDQETLDKATEYTNDLGI